jgi:lipid-A-disaccharide synthase
VMDEIEAAVKARNPRVALLVDVPDFNLRLAKRLKKLGIPVVYFIAPMAWAWREGRTKQLKALVHTLACILPFEEKFFRDRGVNATYVGNPTLEKLPRDLGTAHFRSELGLENVPTLAVLPGSRRGELKRLGAVIAQATKRFVDAHPGTQVVVPVAPGLDADFVEAPFREAGVAVKLINGRAPEVVGASDLALVTSGTATLEAGLMHRPLVCVYRTSLLNLFIGRLLVKLPFFCLVNLLAEKRVVPELLQADANVDRIVTELEQLRSGPARDTCLQGLNEVRAKLEGAGTACSERVAKMLTSFLLP